MRPVLNSYQLKPYKNGVANAFIEHTSKEFAKWKLTAANEEDVFSINLGIVQMKLLIPTFVQRGLAAITTAIAKRFGTDTEEEQVAPVVQATKRGRLALRWAPLRRESMDQQRHYI
jgi:hypothetical protein